MIGVHHPNKRDLKHQKILNKEIEDLHKVPPSLFRDRKT
jgi:hypothetical protein